jgi:hypothetical protein
VVDSIGSTGFIPICNGSHQFVRRKVACKPASFEHRCQIRRC